MTRNTAKEAVNKKLGKKRDEPKIFYGFLGNYQNEVDVPGYPNYVYVTMSDGMVARVYNGVAPSILNLPVICGYDPNQRGAQLLQVLSIRNLPRNDQNPVTPTIPNHHKTHEWIQGTDIVYTQLRQFMPLRPRPVDPMSIYIANGMINVGGVWRLAGDQTVSLAGYVPDTGGVYPRPSGSAIKCKYVLVSIDKTSGSAVVTSGSEVGIYSIGLSDIPATPTGNYPVCAVMLYYYQTKIVEAFSRTDMIDLRWGMFTNGTSPTAQVVPVTTTPTTNQYFTGYNAMSGSFSKGTVIVPTAKAPVADYYLTGYDAVSGSFSSGYMVSGSGAVSGSGVPEAPNDGKQYGRQSLGWTEIISGSGSSGSQVVPLNHPEVAGEALTGYSNATGSFTAGSIVTDHTQLANIGTNTHAEIDSALTRLINTSGSNTGDQVVPVATAPVANFYLTGYDNVSGSFSSGSVIGGSGGGGGSQVVPLDHDPVANFYLTGYDSTTGSFTSGSVAGGTVSGSGGEGTIVFGWNNGTSAIVASDQEVSLPFAGTITGWTILADKDASASIDLWKTNYAGYPPTITNTICGGNLISLTSANKNTDSTLTSWIKTITAGDTMKANLTSVSLASRITLVIKYTKG